MYYASQEERNHRGVTLLGDVQHHPGNWRPLAFQSNILVAAMLLIMLIIYLH